MTFEAAAKPGRRVVGAIKRCLKYFAVIYIACFLLVFLHFPRGILAAAKDVPLVILATPIGAPPILKTYGQFIFAGVWPYSHDPTAIDLNTLLEEYGAEDFTGEKTVRLDTSPPDLEPGQEGGSGMSLYPESYSSWYAGGFYDISGGGLLSPGRYICLLEGRDILRLYLMPSHCFTFHPLGADKFRVKVLGGNHSYEARLLKPDSI